ncbi:hypothetical protein FOCC_FOCC004112 [Frankliniella occidentalis]|nr:hypothetical protein FOCC_FOCC004112 [Frankliniella occidentalis]
MLIVIPSFLHFIDIFPVCSNMVNCSIDGCKSRVGRDKVSFYGLPAVLTRQCELTMELSERRRKCWFERIYRSGFDETSVPRYTRVCANHFITGKPSTLFDVANADWAPSVNLGKSASCLTRSKGYQKRTTARRKKGKDEETEFSCQIKGDRIKKEVEDNPLIEEDERKVTFDDVPGTGCQTEITCEGFTRLEEMYKKLLEENIAMRRELETLKSLVREPSDIEDPLAMSDNEGSSSGLEKVEVILKTEPDPDIDTDANHDPESFADLPSYDSEFVDVPGNRLSSLCARSQPTLRLHRYTGQEVQSNADPRPNHNSPEDKETESDDLNTKIFALSFETQMLVQMLRFQIFFIITHSVIR